MTTISYEDFDEAKAVAGEADMVCGTLLKDGHPRYFVVPKGTPDPEVEDRAFEIREGRQPQAYDRLIRRLAQAARQPAGAAA